MTTKSNSNDDNVMIVVYTYSKQQLCSLAHDDLGIWLEPVMSH